MIESTQFHIEFLLVSTGFFSLRGILFWPYVCMIKNCQNKPCRLSPSSQAISLIYFRYGPREMDRIEWPQNDPTIIAEGVFAVANVFSFARIIYLFQTNPHLGPLQISLGCMIIDIAKFFFIFFLVLTSFACGLNQLYWYYDKDKYCDHYELGTNNTEECSDSGDAFMT